MNREGEATAKPENNPGYKSMELEYRDGHFWLPSGVRLEPDFRVIPDQDRMKLFIEYERTFGRGKAFEITHQITEGSQSKTELEKHGGEVMLARFDRFRELVPMVTAGGGDPEIIQKLIKQLREFRLSYPLLYEDADEYPEPGHLQ